MIKMMGIGKAFKNVKPKTENREEHERTETEDVQAFADWLDEKLVETLEIYVGVIAKYDTEAIDIFKKVEAKLAEGVVDAEDVWDEDDFIGSLLQFHEIYRRLIYRLPEDIATQVMEKVDTWMSRFFNQLL